ncbi:hypothetical protein FVER53590_30323 [Fusarium verticillioides]|nr:hypothetical protein FVER53590_30323 [Fusarium verticillioides]
MNLIPNLLAPFATTTGPLPFQEHARTQQTTRNPSVSCSKSGGDFELSIPSFGPFESRQAPRLAIPLFASARLASPGAATTTRRIKLPSLI